MRKVPTGTRPASHRRRNASSRGTIRPRSALPIDKGRRVRCSNQPLYRRRRRMALLVLVLLLVLLLVVVLAMGSLRVGGMGDERPGQVDAPTFEEAVEEVDESAGDEEEAPEKESSEEKSPEEEATEEKEEPVPAAPDDPTLFLTVPKLGLYNHTVRNDDSEQALDLGAIKMPGTDFPWQEGDKNTYIACHRLGWPGTESHNQCLNLPSMQKGDLIILKDANGAVYRHRVVETLIVGPDDHWVTDPVAGKDMVSLQTCIESPDDLYTLGPDWSYRFVVRAERTEKVDNFRGLVGDSVTAYTGLLHAHVAHHGGVLQTARKSVGGMVRSLWGSLEPVVPSLLYNRH